MKRNNHKHYHYDQLNESNWNMPTNELLLYKYRDYKEYINLCGFLISFSIIAEWFWDYNYMKLLTSVLFFAIVVRSHILPKPPLAVKAECDNIEDNQKFDCYPEPVHSPSDCEARGCCYNNNQQSPKDSRPTCYYPSNFGGYEYTDIFQNDNGQVAFLQRIFQSPYPRDIQKLRLDVEYQTDYRVRVKITDASNARYEAPYPKISETGAKATTNRKYQVIISEDQVGFKIARDDGTSIFDAQNVGAFIYSDLFIQISAIYSGQIYGLGEHRTNLWLDTTWTKFTFFNHDQPPRENTNLYGSHPFYLVVEPNGQSHGVFLHNSNAVEVRLQPLPAITFRTLGGILDFYFFMGPTPGDVIRQYTELIGKPFLPPYWGLGFQLCRYGYDSANNTRAVWQRTRDAGIPYDVQWNDIDYMITQNDFTLDPVNYGNLPELVKDIHDAGMHYVVIVDPGVSASEPAGSYPPYDDGLAMDVFVKHNNGSVLIGKVWNPVSTAFPDFTHPRAQEYWSKQLQEFHNRVPFDAIWIDMNEPSNFVSGSIDGCPDDELENPPYVPTVAGDHLNSNTLCMTAKHYAGSHYNVHNLYGISEAEVTHNALREVLGKRSFVISRSTFAGSGAYTGHWSGDDFSTWNDLTKSIQEILAFSLYGVSFSGADICGFIGNTNLNLCNRWMQLGAFYPFARNHNDRGNIEQDPAVWGQEVIDSSKKALNIRYSLLPYLYTLLYKAHIYGDTVARPLFFEFPDDVNTHQIDQAFLWGSGLYIIPVLEDNATDVTTYLPAGRWYDWYTGVAVDSNGDSITLDAPFDKIPLLIRGGVVLPTQEPAVTTTLSRKNGFTFIVAPDVNGNSYGSLFWDDGESLDTVKNNEYGILNFGLSKRHFISQVQQWKTSDTPRLDSIKILGVTEYVSEVTVNGESVDFKIDSNHVLTITDIGKPLSTEIDLVWKAN